MTAWTLSGFGDEIHPDPSIQAAVILALGASHIEVRSAWGINVVDWDDEMLERYAGVLDQHNLQASAIASPIGKVDVSLPAQDEVDRLRRVIRVALRLKSKYIRIFSFYRGTDLSHDDIRDAVLERMSMLAAEAAKHDLILVHENEKDIYGDTPDRVLDLVESVDSPALKLAWDSANFVQVGVKPFSNGYAALRPHVVYLQVKDAIASTGEVVPAGEGDGELRETLTAMRDDGYNGFASLEPHLASAHALGGFSGPQSFGTAARALHELTRQIGVTLV